MRILVINDPHIAWTAPLGRVDDYFESIMEKLFYCMQLSHVKKAMTVITGDLFHHKRTTQIPYEMLHFMLPVFQAFHSRPLVIPGNHDLGPEGTSGLLRRPLMALAHMGGVNIMVDNSLETDDFWAYFLAYSATHETNPDHYSPLFWFSDSDSPIDHPTYEEMEEARAAGKPLIMFAHAPIIPIGESRPYPHLTLNQIPGWDTIDYWFVGHVHDDFGVRQYDGTTFVNVGSLARVSRTQMNMTRVPKVALLDTETRTVEEIEVPHRPASEVFRLEVPHGVGLSDELSAFAGALAQGLEAEQFDLKTLIHNLDADEETARLVEELLREEGL